MKRLKIFCSVILLLVMLLFTGCEKKLSLQEYLDLGDKYLTESNYEQAIVAFTKAIELEPKAMKAYEGLANAYIKTENYEKAQEVLETGISVYEGLTAEEQTDEFEQIYETLLNLKEEVKVYHREKNDVQDEQKDAENFDENTEVSDTDKERLIAEAKEKYGDILNQIITALDSGTLELTGYYTEDFVHFVHDLEEPLYWQIEDGRYLGLYTDGDVYIYLGEIKNGLRSGSGFWYSEYDFKSGPEFVLYTGSWSEDYPNGPGTFEDVFTDEDGETIREKYEGNYLDGYENGTMRLYVNEYYYMDNVKGNYTGTYEYKMNRGVPDHLTTGETVVMRIIQEFPSDMGPVYSYDIDSPWGIDGAMKE